MSDHHMMPAPNLLIADDTPELLQLLADLLTNRGYQVRAVPDGRSALVAARAELPDLILLDIMMPSLDGYAVCQQLKTEERTRDIPIIFLSGKGEAFDKVKAFSIGGADYITKPFQMEEMFARIENQLHVRQLQKQLEAQNARLQQEIRDRQEVEAALGESEQKLLKLAANVPGMIYQFQLAPDGSISFPYISSGSLELYELEPEAIQQHPSLPFTGVHPDDIANLEASLAESAATLQSWQQEWRQMLPSGTVKWLKGASRPERQADGSTLWNGVVVDISERQAALHERKQAELALQVASERLQYLLAASPAVIYSCKAGGDYGTTFVSENVSAMLGYEAREFIEDSSFWATHIHLEDVERVFTEIQQLGEIGDRAYEYRFLHQDGTYRWIYDRLRVVQDAAGNPIEFVGYWADITARKQSEERLRLLERAVEACSNGIVISDFQFPDHPVIYVNPAFEAITGYSAAETIGQNCRFLQGNDFHQPGLAEIRQAIREQRECRVILRNYRKDGSLFWNEFSMSPVRDANGYLTHYVGIQTDITEEQTAVETLSKQFKRTLLLKQITEEIRSSLDLQQIFATAAQQIGQTLKVDRCLIHTYVSEPEPRIPIVAEFVASDYQSLRFLEIPVVDNPHAQRMLAQDVAVASPEIDTDPLLQAMQPLCHKIGLKSLLGVRTSYQGEPNGAIGLHQCSDVREWTTEDIDLLESIAAQLGIAIAQAKLLEQEKQARAALDRQNLQLQQEIRERQAALRERSLAEAALQKSESKYRNLVETSKDVIWALDKAGRYTFVNSAVKQIYGYKPEEMIGRSFIDFLAPEHIAKDRDVFQQLLAGASIFQYETTHLAKNGDPIHFMFNAIPLRNEAGAVVGTTGTANNISDRKQAEVEIRLLLAATQAISGAADVESALAIILQLICTTIGWDFGEAWIPSPDGTVLEYSPGWYGRDRTLIEFRRYSEGIAFSTGKGLAGRIWQSRQPEWIEDVSAPNVQRFLRSQVAAQVGLKAGFGIPILANDQVLAILVFFKRAKTPLERRLLDLVGAVAAQLGWLIERKQAEASLRQSEATNRALLNAIPDMMFRCKADGTYIDFKPAKDIKTFAPASAFLGKKPHEVLPPELAQKIWHAYEQTIASGQTQILEYQLAIDGERRDYEARIVATGNDEIITMVRDITQRKQSETALRESAQRESAIARVIQRMRQTLDFETIFAATTQELRQLIHCDRVAVYRFNSDWSGEFVAESLASNWTSLVQEQTSDSSLTGNVLEDQNCTLKKLGEPPRLIADSYLKETQGGAYVRGVSYLVTEDIYQAGFTPCYINLLEQLQARAYIIVPIFCGSKLWGLLAIYQNTAPRQWKEAEINIVVQIGTQLGVALQQAELLAQTQRQSEELQQAVIAADAANRAKSEFLANMSHELRTPLNAILGFAQMMSRDKSLSLDQQEHLTIINRAGEHLLELINDILEMSKIETGKITLDETNFDLIRLLDGLEKLLRLRAASKGLQLIFQCEPDVPQFIRTDEKKLRQVLLNLLGNAIKFTQKGRVILRVSTGEWESRDSAPVPVPGAGEREKSPSHPLPTTHYPLPITHSLIFEVEDTGSGIAAHEIDLLFEAFRQTETGRKSQQGTGLGLAISRRYVQLMGGEIKVSSQLGQGSIFGFTIQIGQADAAQIKIIPESRKVIHIAPGQPQYRILVVDDCLESRLLLVQLLTSIGFDVREAETGQDAITLWESWAPHLIWMDMRMPVLDGVEATQQIKATPKGQKTIVIAFTASAFEEQRQLILAAGCDDFVGKPFREEVLLEKMRQYLGVEYIYEEERIQLENNNLIPEATLTADHLTSLLAQMPAAWVKQLHHAAAQCDDNLILDLLTQVPPESAGLVDTLAELANNFQFEKIMELMKPLLS